MIGEIYAKIEIDDTDRKKITEAISTMESVVEAMRKTGVGSCGYAINDLNDGICQLHGVLEGKYW